jgi:hypothetical protein
MNGAGMQDMGLHAPARSTTQCFNDDQSAGVRLIPKQSSKASGSPALLHSS